MVREVDEKAPRVGLEDDVDSSANMTVSETGGAESGAVDVQSGAVDVQSGAVDVQSGAVDADLTRLLDAWPTLPADVKTTIAQLVENSGYAPGTD